MALIRAKMRVRCVVEVDVGVWNADANFKLLREQVAGEGINRLKNMQGQDKSRLTVIGEPTVMAVLLEDE